MAQVSNRTIQKFWWQFIKKHRTHVGLIFLSGCISRYTTLLLSLSIGKYLEIAFNNSTGKSKALELLGIYLPANIYWFYLFFATTTFLHFVVTWLYQFMQSVTGNNLVTTLRMQWVEKTVIRANPGQYKFADIMLPFTNEHKTIATYFNKGIIGMAINGCYLATVLYVGLALSPFITLLTGLLCLIIYVLLQVLNNKLRPLEKSKRDAQGGMVKWLSQYLSQPGTDSTTFNDKLNLKMSRLSFSVQQLAMLKGLYLALIPALMYCLLGLVLLLLANGQGHASLPPSDIVTLILLIMLSLPALKTLFRKNNLRQQGRLALNKFLDSPEAVIKADLAKKSNNFAEISVTKL
ncbi:MAG: ABC transporter transmembrane domain-containing protein [Flavihumibacter sp.]|nr:ABC transporter transmembrane domain-containing protein [Flavihumibacter sp.]